MAEYREIQFEVRPGRSWHRYDIVPTFDPMQYDGIYEWNALAKMFGMADTGAGHASTLWGAKRKARSARRRFIRHLRGDEARRHKRDNVHPPAVWSTRD